MAGEPLAGRKSYLASSANNGLPELLSPAAVAQILKVEETDVIATLTDGSLKGKKIGSTWRITKTALDAFLAH